MKMIRIRKILPGVILVFLLGQVQMVQAHFISTLASNRVSFAGSELVLRQAIANKIKIWMPRNFVHLDEAEIKEKYPLKSLEKMEIWADEARGVNVGFELTRNHATPDQLPDYLMAFRRQFNQMENLDLRKSGMILMKNRQFIRMEIISQSPEGPVYNLMMVTSLDERLLLCTFNCTKPMLRKWKSTGEEIMNSIEIEE